MKESTTKTHPISQPSKRYLENILTPVHVSGVVVPWIQNLSRGQSSDYKLISQSGLEYFMIADDEWREVLLTYCWDEVLVIGLLNASNMTLIPQKVCPKGPTDKNVVELAPRKTKELVKKLVKKVNDLVAKREEDFMYFENSVKPVSPAFLRNDSSRFNQNRETFHDIIQRTLQNRSSSRPPKIELTGVLVPCNKTIHGCSFKFKLETDSEEYFLNINEGLAMMARRLEWEEVTVRGFLDLDKDIFDVEKISLAKINDPLQLSTDHLDAFFDLDRFKQTIDQRGQIELDQEYLAS